MTYRLTRSIVLACVSCLASISSLQAKEAQQTDVATRQQKKLVLALGGGGTRGAAHVGVLRVLEKNGIKVDAIVGTSIGAIVGGFYCSGLSADDIEKILLRKSFLRSYLIFILTTPV